MIGPKAVNAESHEKPAIMFPIANFDVIDGMAFVSSTKTLAVDAEKPVDEFSDAFWREFSSQVADTLIVLGDYEPRDYLQFLILLMPLVLVPLCSLMLASLMPFTPCVVVTFLTAASFCHCGLRPIRWPLPYMFTIAIVNLVVVSAIHQNVNDSSAMMVLFASTSLYFYLKTPNDSAAIRRLLGIIDAHCRRDLRGYTISFVEERTSAKSILTKRKHTSVEVFGVFTKLIASFAKTRKFKDSIRENESEDFLGGKADLTASQGEDKVNSKHFMQGELPAELSFPLVGRSAASSPKKSVQAANKRHVRWFLVFQKAMSIDVNRLLDEPVEASQSSAREPELLVSLDEHVSNDNPLRQWKNVTSSSPCYTLHDMTPPDSVSVEAWKNFCQDIIQDVREYERLARKVRNVAIINLMISLAYYACRGMFNVALPLHVSAPLFLKLRFQKQMEEKIAVIDKFGCSPFGPLYKMSFQRPVGWLNGSHGHVLFQQRGCEAC